ncbi:hypothetical protein PN499_06205 [Kamptonema animale CS-326]|uniref:hypothetical protein n=1 Tax=Kamptonema animale TaxID=92934 RepID=UPI00232E35F6|nr:hypothetical protein [Kamptonema animale]MDB9510768.1 hypothetical protein [Kamptonema animale CS-326]
MRSPNPETRGQQQQQRTQKAEPRAQKLAEKVRSPDIDPSRLSLKPLTVNQ